MLPSRCLFISTPPKFHGHMYTIYMRIKKYYLFVIFYLTPFELSDLSESDATKGHRNEPTDNIRISYQLAEKPLSIVRIGSNLIGGLESECGREKPRYIVSVLVVY